MSERSRPRALAVVLIVAALGLAGCTDAPAKPKPLPSPTSSSPAASPSETAPTLPPAAKGTSAASAEAFARHYVDLINYAMHTGDTDQMTRLAERSCSTCFALSSDIAHLYRGKGRAEGGGWRVEGNTRAARKSGGVVFLRFRIRIRPQTIFESPGASPSNSGAGNGRLEFEVRRPKGAWSVARLGAFQ